MASRAATVTFEDAVINPGAGFAVTLGSASLTVYGTGTVSGVSGGAVTIIGAHLTVTGEINGSSVSTGNNASLTLGGSASMTGSAVITLGNNAALTVGGPLNVSPEAIAVASATATPATINGSGTIYLTANGRLLSIPASKGLVLDGSLVLSGQTSGVNNNAPLVYIGGGELEMKGNVAIKDNKRGTDADGTGGYGAGVYVDYNGIFTMRGGLISGNPSPGISQAPGCFSAGMAGVSSCRAEKYRATL